MQAKHWIAVTALAFLTALPLAAGHRHGRDCGHRYSRAARGWISIGVHTPYGGGYFSRAPSRGYYSRDPYYDDRRAHKRHRKYLKKRYKRQRRHRNHYDRYDYRRNSYYCPY